jgi:hypothetical protein
VAVDVRRRWFSSLGATGVRSVLSLDHTTKLNSHPPLPIGHSPRESVS